MMIFHLSVLQFESSVSGVPNASAVVPGAGQAVHMAWIRLSQLKP